MIIIIILIDFTISTKSIIYICTRIFFSPSLTEDILLSQTKIKTALRNKDEVRV